MMSSNSKKGSSLLKSSMFKFSDGSIPGVRGIVNHGNSCFANAVIQCMSNTEYLGEFFVSGRWRAELIASGIECPVTEQLALLIESLWMCTYDRGVSKNFFSVIDRYSAIFTAEKQNDAHEFLLWLLNCVNDEISGTAGGEVYKSPKARSKAGKSRVSYESNAEIDDEGKKVVKVEKSQSYTSMISRLFQGQFHSLLTCPVCKSGSEKVEPFLFLPLHIPEIEFHQIPVYVTVVRSCLRGVSLEKVLLRLKIYETVKDLRLSLAERMGFKFTELVLLSIDEHCGFGKTFQDSTTLYDIESELDSLFAVQLVSDGSCHLNQPMFVIAVNSVNTEGKTTIFGSPVVIQVFDDMNVYELQTTFLYAIQTLLYEKTLDQLTIQEKPSELFHMKLVDDRLHSKCIPDDGSHQPFIDDADIISRFMTSMDGSPCYLRMTLDWQASAFKRFVNQNLIENALTVAENTASESLKVTLCDCLAFFTQNETLESGTSWYCSKCSSHQAGAIKTLSLLTTPDALIIQLKRFTQNDVHNSKLAVFVDFPTTHLDLSCYVKKSRDADNGSNKNDYLYDLYAVCNHYGSMSSGHYTAFCKNPVNCQWYRFDDDNVQECDVSELVTEAAYLLFYQRRSRQLPSLDFSLCEWASAVCTADDSDSNCSSTSDEVQVSSTREATDRKANRTSGIEEYRQVPRGSLRSDRHDSHRNIVNSESVQCVYDRLANSITASTSPRAAYLFTSTSKSTRERSELCRSNDFHQNNSNLNSSTTYIKPDWDTQHRTPPRASSLSSSRGCVSPTQHHQQQSSLKTSPRSTTASTRQSACGNSLVSSSRSSHRFDAGTLKESSRTSDHASCSTNAERRARLIESTQFPRPLPPSPRGTCGSRGTSTEECLWRQA